MIDDFTETLGVNDRVQLAESAAMLRDRINDQWMRSGVTIIDPTTTWIHSTVELSSDVTLNPILYISLLCSANTNRACRNIFSNNRSNWLWPHYSR